MENGEEEMINIAICDDSSEFRRLFENAVMKYTKDIFPQSLQNIKIADFDQTKKVLEFLEKESIDILFLDIDMPGMSGLELAKRLSWKNANTIAALGAIVLIATGFGAAAGESVLQGVLVW